MRAPSTPSDRILVRQLRLWAHVGVLDVERERGQWFELDLDLALDLATSGCSDQVTDTLDYAVVITALQRQARKICCRTLEHYAEEILDLVERCVADQLGPNVRLPALLELRKCAAPVSGFTGRVAVLRARSWPASFITAEQTPCGRENPAEPRGGEATSS